MDAIQTAASSTTSTKDVHQLFSAIPSTTTTISQPPPVQLLSPSHHQQSTDHTSQQNAPQHTTYHTSALHSTPQSVDTSPLWHATCQDQPQPFLQSTALPQHHTTPAYPLSNSTDTLPHAFHSSTLPPPSDTLTLSEDSHHSISLEEVANHSTTPPPVEESTKPPPLEDSTKHPPSEDSTKIPLLEDSVKLDSTTPPPSEDSPPSSGDSHHEDIPPSSKRQRLDILPESFLYSYGGGKPVGIAQPFQKESQQGGTHTHREKESMFAKSAELVDKSDLIAGAKRGYLKGYDSGTDSTGSFELPCAPSDLPDSSDEGGEKVKESESKRSCDGHHRNGEERRNECKKLPKDKRYHIFLTHSTSDEQWARDIIVQPLTSSQWKVKACYQYMPDSSRYDDRGIKEAMKASCVIVIGLSPAYLRSLRCDREWKLAVDFSHRSSKVVVAAVLSCNRPERLKRFEYLDFICNSRRGLVWRKFTEIISNAVHKQLQAEQTSLAGSQASLAGSQGEQTSLAGSQASLAGSQGEQTSLAGSQGDQTSLTGSQASLAGSQGERTSLAGSQGEQTSLAGSQTSLLGSQAEQTWSQGEHYFSDSGSQDSSQCTSEQTGHMMAHFEELWNAGEGEHTADEDDGHLIGGKEGQAVGGDACDGGETRDSENGGLVEQACVDPLDDGPNSQQSHDQSHDVEEQLACDPEESDSEVRGQRDGSEEGEVSDSSGELEGTEEHQVSDVAVFYDNLARPDADKRDESPIKLMRNFNNWVKSVLIRSYLKEVVRGAVALDICCGKGGDLLKWKEGRISHLVCADISSESINAAQERYRSRKMIDRRGNLPYSADFYVTDCTAERLLDLAGSHCIYHISSCQFSVHYSFESYEKAHMMLRNACENLRPGGYFIGTTIDADQLVYRLRSKGRNPDGSWSIGNSLFTVTLDSDMDINNLPLFGARYNFRLHGVVDLPEFLVYFPLLEKMLEPFQMGLVRRQNFLDFFEEHRHKPDDCCLLYKMEAFDRIKGTMSSEQWEAVGLYLVYVFQKKDYAHIATTMHNE